MCLPLLAQSLDVSGMGLLLPSIGDDLHATDTALAWVMNANALAFGALLLTAGRVADRIGSRPLLLGGVAGFGVASLLCAFAPGTGWLVAARALQGVASSACFTTSLAVVDATFDERHRPGAIGLWGAVSGAGSAFGPLVAGALADSAGWRWFFVVNVPLCAVAVPVIAILVARGTGAPGPGRTPARSTGSPVGLLALGVGFVAVSLAVGASSGPLARLVPFVIALACAAVLLREHRRHRPVVTPAAVEGPWSQAALAVGFCSTWAFAATIVVGSGLLQDVRGMTPLQAGVTFLAFSGAFALAGAAVGRLVRSAGPGRAMAVAMVVAAAGTLALAAPRPSGPLVALVVALAVAGFGQGLAFDASTTASLSRIPGPATAEATGAEQTSRLLGSVLGVAASSAIVVAAGSGSTGAGPRVALLVAAAVTALGAVAARLLSTASASAEGNPGPAQARH